MNKVRKKVIREKAIIAVYQYLLTQVNNDEIDAFLLNDNTFKNNEEELKLCKERINSTIDHYDEYVNKIKPHLKKGWTIQRLSKMELAILLVAVDELQTENKSVVINEAVELTKKYCDDDSYKFINGILNNIG
ncbi:MULTISPECIES: transcription antitermination factor NusB [Coprobacillaceae]|uniref:transcription antitermination factor NusB n=1 Tax=Coprobacillaceae TaxID=2810280 RepID=UPI000E46B09F|nr:MULTISPECIES: transcription antitermination factor NusB [Coprobacillaceae]RHM63636.1 transcription antitermination factor NusB [Coprobacillus sp. AF33-1AC]RHS96365.1 transcription antitermination factor NusB [Erysipelatoclostridium sp. AM42-17]